MPIQLKAAFGKVKITPEEPAPLQGYNPETNIADPAKDVLDDLHARVLILDDGLTRSIIVNVDCCLTNEENVEVADPSGQAGSYREFVNTFPAGSRARWAKAAGTNIKHISINATHTHTAPAHFTEKYINRIERLIQETLDRLAPVKISISSGESKVSAFRRPTLRADLSVPVNQSLRVIYFETEEQQPLGAIVNYAVHPTALRNPTNRISSDLVGLAVNDVEQRVNSTEGEGEFTCLFLQGFSGDVCPLYGDNLATGDTYPNVIEGSLVLSNDIMRVMNENRIDLGGKMTSNTKKIELPTKEGFYKDDMSLTLMGIAIDRAVILSISGEIFNGYIDKIDQTSPFDFNLLSGVSNGYSGYIPTLQAFEDGKGGYEMRTTPYSSVVEGIFMKEVRTFIYDLYEKHNKAI